MEDFQREIAEAIVPFTIRSDTGPFELNNCQPFFRDHEENEDKFLVKAVTKVTGNY